VNLDVGFHRESFPEQIKKISIHRGGGGLANFVVLANSKLTGFTAVSFFFTLTRDEPKKSPALVAGQRRASSIHERLPDKPASAGTPVQ
ncbi:hypothetical protein, partial [Marinobacter salarius]|uniref:hypothetical protein n=1 Tax=Marinobacter salarius TaxID=1420917 RepID=UPI0032EEE3A0